MVNTARIDRLRQTLTSMDCDGVVISHPANVRYLTGFPAEPTRPSCAVIGSKKAVLVAPGNLAAVQSRLAAGIVAIGYAIPGPTLDQVADVPGLSAARLDAALTEVGLDGQRIGVEENHISARHAGIVARHGTIVPIDGTVEALRRTKDAEELVAIQAAIHANDVGFAAARDAIRPGVTEFDVAQAVVGAMQEATNVPIDVLDDTNCFVSGPNTAVSVGLPTSRQLAPGDLMIIDLNPFIDGYKGDTTRTFSVGPASAEHQHMHDVLVQSLEAAERMARPGVSGRAVYAAMADTIGAAGYGAGMMAHGGHALGLEHVERPYVIPAEEMLLEEGMILTLEPGIYLPDVGGLRVEDNYLVTSSGLEVLSHFPRELVQCGT